MTYEPTAVDLALLHLRVHALEDALLAIASKPNATVDQLQALARAALARDDVPTPEQIERSYIERGHKPSPVRLVASGKVGPALGSSVEYVLGNGGLRGRTLVEAVFESRACGRTSADEYEAASDEQEDGGAA